MLVKYRYTFCNNYTMNNHLIVYKSMQKIILHVHITEKMLIPSTHFFSIVNRPTIIII